MRKTYYIKQNTIYQDLFSVKVEYVNRHRLIKDLKEKTSANPFGPLNTARVPVYLRSEIIKLNRTLASFGWRKVYLLTDSQVVRS